MPNQYVEGSNPSVSTCEVEQSGSSSVKLRKVVLRMNTNTIGNMTESVVLSEFQKMEIPVSIPFGRNEPYDLL